MELKGAGKYIDIVFETDGDLVPVERNEIERWMTVVAKRTERDLQEWFAGTGTGLLRRVK